MRFIISLCFFFSAYSYIHYILIESKTTVDDHFNGKNNVVQVKKSDFEVMDALDIDLNQTVAQQALNQKSMPIGPA